MTPFSTRALTAALIATAALGLGGCAKLHSHQGYVIDADLVNSVRPGIDNKKSVIGTLGNPTFTDAFGGNVWYYVSRNSRAYAFNLPRAEKQVTIKLTFDKAGNVASVTKMGVAEVARVTPYGKTTPTLGRKRGFFQDLFGNIGQVGAGAGGPGGGGGGGAGN